MLEIEDRAAQQRSFYLKLSPQGGGDTLAQVIGGFTPPGADSQEAEMRDNIGLWLKMQASGASSIVGDTSWWMTRFMDRYARMSKDESERRSTELMSYAIATMGILMEKNIIKFINEPEIPKLVTSTYDPINADIMQATLDRMEAGLKKDETA